MSIDAEILRELNLSRFVALDLETTGLQYQKEEIIEIGAIRYLDGAVEEELSLLIKPSKPIPHYISRITGITDDDVHNAPAFAEISDEIRKFIGDDPLIAHNISFDLSFLEHHFRRVLNMPPFDDRKKDYLVLPNDKYDTLLLAKTYLPFLTGFTLSHLADYFQIQPEKLHRALPDARVAGEVFLRLVEITLRTNFRDVRKILQILEPTDEPLKNYFFQLQKLLSTGKYHFPPLLDKESFIYSANYYNIIGEGDTPSVGKLKIEPIDEEEIGSFFDESGILEKTFGAFELRKAQVKMAREVARAFNEQKFLVVEAGTGTGKSMAYLLPGIKWSVKNYGPFGRVIISTNTKNLQEQLFFKDIPILHSILKEKFKAVLLKGKGNYLCLDKWFTALNDMKFRLNTYERVKILPLYFWVKNTETGDISENNGFSAERNMGLWSKLIAENNYCPGKSCKYYNQCFLMRARNNARDAHLVLVNHSLLFSDLAAEQAILSDYSNVILDEAHNIEKVATEYLGVEISLWNFRDVFRKLYYKERMETGILVQMQRRVNRANMEEVKKKFILDHLKKLIPLISTNWQYIQGFFRELTRQLEKLLPEKTETNYSVRFRYRREDELLKKLESYYLELMDYLKKVLAGINDLLELLKEVPDDSFKYQKQISQELQAQFSQIDGLKTNLEFLVAAEFDDWVYWFELPVKENTDDSRLYAAPLNISEILNEKLYKKLNTAIFTSATLTVGRSFDYFLDRVGLKLVDEDRLQTLLLESPFNYEEQVLLAVPAFMPDPRSPEFREEIKNFLHKMVQVQRRGTLVLFTSYSLLNNLYSALRLPYQSQKIPLLAQGIDGSRHAIMNRFKEVPDSVLFGTDSFWEGVDVPGKALEMLLITKLPFDVPSEPIIQAKAEMIRKRGGNPFMEYTIPEAVIRLRQGFGRLIRSKSDFGAVIILDNRVIKKMYGRIFLQSLPVRTRIFQTEEELWQQLKQWFGQT